MSDRVSSEPREHESSNTTPSWMTAAQSNLHAASRPVSHDFAALAKDPSKVALLARQDPMAMPRLLQQALVHDPELARRVADVIEREFLASAGHGSNANAMLVGGMALEGEGAVAARAELERIVNKRDAQWQEPLLPTPVVDTQRSLLERTAKDPLFGKLYALYQTDPFAAAALLKDLSLQDPTTLESRIRDLRWMVQERPDAADRFVRAVVALSGPGAALVKAYVVRELYSSMAKDLEAVAQVDEFAPGTRTPVHVRVEKLVPLLAEVVSNPDVARMLVKFDKSIEPRPPDVPDLRVLLTAVLRSSYSEATRVSVRVSITQGGADMLKRSVASRDQQQSDEWAGQAGTFLGKAATADAKVGIEDSIVEGVKTTLDQLAKVTPGGTGKVMKLAATLVGFAPHDKADPEWTRHTVDELLAIVYSGVHAQPAEPLGGPDREQWDRDLWRWRKDASQEFLNEYQGG